MAQRRGAQRRSSGEDGEGGDFGDDGVYVIVGRLMESEWIRGTNAVG